MADEYSVHSEVPSDSEPDVQTPQSKRSSVRTTPNRARSCSSSVDNVADMIARRQAMEKAERDGDNESDEEDITDIYAQMRNQILGGQTKKSSAAPSTTKSSRRQSPARESAAPNSVHSSDSASDSDAPVVSRKRARPARLFQTASGSESDSESDDLPDLDQSSRLQELITLRRKERKEKERLAALERENAARANSDTITSHAAQAEEELDTGDADAVLDPLTEERLTQQSRPTRKASKKAIEEMNKETQRMNRNMQLTHQAKVKTKFSIADFAARFTAKSNTARGESEQPPNISPALASSDVDNAADTDTPPSSPPSVNASFDLGKSILGSVNSDTSSGKNTAEEVSSLEDILAQSLRKKATGKEPVRTVEEVLSPKKSSPQRLDVRMVNIGRGASRDDSSDDDELEIVKDRFSIFDEIKPRKASESRAFQNLRYLANMNNHEVAGRSKNAKASITSAELDMQLRKRAALQAQQERDEKIATLRAKGIIVQTAEERERDMMEIENLLEKAREEAEDLRKKEKAQAKADGKELGLEASDDESDDEEWHEEEEHAEIDERAEDDEDDENDEMDVSGSEDEDLDEEEEGEESNQLLDDAAAEGDDHSEEERQEEDSSDKVPAGRSEALPMTGRRLGRKKFVIQDDDDDDESASADALVDNIGLTTQESIEPGSVDDIAAAFGFAAAPLALMSPSQMFAGTMGASQTQRLSQSQTQEQDSMDLFNQIVPSRLSPQPGTPLLESGRNRQQIDAFETPTVVGYSQLSNIPTPSQDVGFGQVNRSIRLEQSVDPPSTVDTIDTVLQIVPESPVQKRRGRLQSRRIVDDDDEAMDQHELVGGTASETPEKTTTAFDVLRKAAARPSANASETDFDRKKSGAKNMVDEQAEESEDEYAGLGGASDDDSDAEADALDMQMLDESDIKVDERKMAAFYAEKERADNEAQTSKLYKDLMSGALRRQRGDAFDLDSDEDEQLAERRRRKQREEARKRRLLLGDEKLGKFDGNQKKEAFLRAIEDRDEEEEGVDMLDGKDRDAEEVVPNSQTESSEQPLSQTTDQPLQQAYDGPFKRPTLTSTVSRGRTAGNAAFVKPSSIAEVRASVSFLVDEPHIEAPADVELSDAESDAESHADTEEDQRVPEADRPHFSARRTPAPPQVVDRLLIRKTSSALSAVSDGAGGVAFIARSSSAVGSFRAPSLLRRATGSALGQTPASLKRDASNASSTTSGERRAGGKKSSIAYAAREAERRAVLDGVEKRRKEDVKRIASMRRGGGLAGLAGRSGFE
ncbi:hypothetical protein ANO11243_037730 [Dothideomycetidae sp. 11243]|nr:hypothetical protein ANO11243_037730 [fungal sp. No.11243]